jgi:enolase-phosphatase E1
MIKFILMDVEGTTTSKDFVYQTLFPYAQRELESFIERHKHEDSIKKIMADVIAVVGNEDKIKIEQADCSRILQEWMLNDKKIAPLKNLQGLIWEEGYQSGKIKGHVYPEVAAQWQKWVSGGMALGIYSSGSVLAQKLLFKYSDSGDLTSLLSAHFDTAVGPKRESVSYDRIATELRLKREEILFLSDIVEELDAAQKAGLQVMLVERDLVNVPTYQPYIRDFTELKN